MIEDFVNGDIPKTGDKSGLYIAFFVRKSVISLPVWLFCAAMSLLKFFQVQGENPNCESVRMSDYMLTYKIILNTRILG